MSRGRDDHFRGAAIPVAVAGVAGAVVHFAIEARMPSGGAAARAAYASSYHLTEVRVGLAVGFSLLSLLPLRGLLRDRHLLTAPDDRLPGEYLAAGLLTILFGAMVGAVGAVAVGAAVVAGFAVVRRRAVHHAGAVGRDLQNAAVLGVAGAALYLGVRECYATWAGWAPGVGAPEGTLEQYAGARGAGVVLTCLAVLAVASALPLPVVLWRHRRSLESARPMSVFAGGGVTVMGLVAGLPPVAAVGIGCLLASLLLPPRRRRQRPPVPSSVLPPEDQRPG